MAPGRRRRRKRRERNQLRVGEKPILCLCVCVCRRKRLLPEDGLDEALGSQSPTRVLGWDEEQRKRCVRDPGALGQPGVHIPGLGWK